MCGTQCYTYKDCVDRDRLIHWPTHYFFAVSSRIVLLKSSRGTRSRSDKRLNWYGQIAQTARDMTNLVDEEQEVPVVCVQVRFVPSVEAPPCQPDG